MATLIEIVDGSTNWGAAMRSNLQALNSGLATSDAKATAALNLAAKAASVRTVNGIQPDDQGNIVVPIVDQTARDSAAAKYTKPSAGIPKTDLASAVQSSLTKADSASQPGHTHVAADITNGNTTWAQIGRAIATGTGLQGGGTLAADRTISLTSAVQASLAKADTAVQPAAISALQAGGRLGARSANVSGTNLNNITENGSYSGDNLVNSPDGSNGFFYIDHFQSTNTDEYAWQRAAAGGLGTANAGYGWQRFREGGSDWSSWDLISDSTGAVDGGIRGDVAYRFGKYLTDVSGGDLNDFGQTGVFRGSNLQNAPTGSNGWFFFSVVGHDSGWARQTADGFEGGFAVGTWTRVKTANTWGAWRQVADGTGALDSAARTTANAAVPASAAGQGQVFIKNGSNVLTGTSYSTGVAANTIAQRDSAGALAVATPTSGGHATTKTYVDGLVGAKYTKPSTGIPDSDLASKFVKTVNGNTPDANGNVSITVEGGGYIKPTNGIPSTDMTSAVQASLAKADSALQSAPVTSVNSKTGAVSLSASDVGAAPASHTHTASQISDSTTFGRGVLTAADAGTARAAINAADAGVSITGTGSLTGGGNLTASRTLDLSTAAKASLAKADTALQSAPVTSVAGRTGAITLTSSDVGLGNVNNTSDVNKPLSTAQQTYIDARTPNGLRGTSAQRDSFYGTSNVPAGSYWWNTDMQWEERYFVAYTGAGNVDISRAAGWYPVLGRMPTVEADNNATAQSIPSATTTVLAMSRTSLAGGFTSGTSGAGTGFTVPFTGRYSAYVTGAFASGTGTRELSVRVNGSTFATGSMSIASATNPTLTAALPTLEIIAGAIIDFRVYQTAATINFTVNRAGITYLGPL